MIANDKRKGKKRILLVDDDYESMSDLIDILEYYGYAAELDASAQVVDRLKHERFDLICIDMMIHSSGLDPSGREVQNICFDTINWRETGIEFYRRLRSGRFNDSPFWGTSSNVPVIFLTACSTLQFEYDISDERLAYLEKPFWPQVLVELISRLTA